MLTVVCFWWFDPKGKCNNVYIYGPEHVKVLHSMVKRNLSLPHEFVCVTDRPDSVPQGIRAVKLDKSTHIPGTRYAKLMLFRRDIEQVLGKRIAYIDLDCVVVGNLDPIFDREEDLVLWRNPNHAEHNRRAYYNTSIMLLSAGCRPEFRESFSPETSPAKAARRTSGSDQAWISMLANKKEPFWGDGSGIYGARRGGDISPGASRELPKDARIVFFPGRREPSMTSVRAQHPWIAEHRW